MNRKKIRTYWVLYDTLADVVLDGAVSEPSPQLYWTELDAAEAKFKIAETADELRRFVPRKVTAHVA